MILSKLKWTLGFACWAIVGSAFAWQANPAREIKRIYVEPFTTEAASAKLREDFIAELRKLRSISLATDASSADAILGGSGEVWIKGYRSLNPRSGRLPSNGTPVYTGFLAVELKDAKDGSTLWSYLATPGAASEDISNDLSKRIVMHLADALGGIESVDQAAPLPPATTTIKGAGATFPEPVYSKWFANYRRENPTVQVTYDPIGSEAGVRRLVTGDVDFSGSDNPAAIREIAPGNEGKYLLFPSVVGAVVPIVNLPGFPNDVAFTPEALAGIFMGKIKKWNDPILMRANRGLHLPDLDIAVVHRADGSGTSYAWTDYLSKTSPEWKAQVGTGMAPGWPTGRAANGNEGVAQLVKERSGSIGYVEFIYALQQHMSYGKVRNRNGEFVAASLESIGEAASRVMEISDDFSVSLTDAPGAGVYPISSFTWLIVPVHIADEAKQAALTGLLKWMLGPGQRQAAVLGYVALPRDLVSRELAALSLIH